MLRVLSWGVVVVASSACASAPKAKVVERRPSPPAVPTAHAAKSPPPLILRPPSTFDVAYAPGQPQPSSVALFEADQPSAAARARCEAALKSVDYDAVARAVENNLGATKESTWLPVFPPRSTVAVFVGTDTVPPIELGPKAQWREGAADPVLVCVRERFEKAGEYRSMTSLPMDAHIRIWEAFALRWTDGRWLAVQSLHGGPPPSTLGRFGGDTAGPRPLRYLVQWVDGETRVSPSRPPPVVDWPRTELATVTDTGDELPRYPGQKMVSALRLVVRFSDAVRPLPPPRLYLNGISRSLLFPFGGNDGPVSCGERQKAVQYVEDTRVALFSTCVRFAAQAQGAVELRVRFTTQDGFEGITERKIVTIR
jgi:hypothetical protein